MQTNSFPLELVSNFISIVILISIFYRYYQYKQKLDILRKFQELKKQKKLTLDDKSFLSENFDEYTNKYTRLEALLKLLYPIFIMAIAMIILLFDFGTAMIHINIVIVSVIYFYVKKIHIRNYLVLLKDMTQ